MELNSNLVTLCFPARCLGCGLELSPFSSDRRPGKPTIDNGNGYQSKERQSERTRPSVQGNFDDTFDAHWCRDCWRQLSDSAPDQCRKCGANLYHPNPIQNACALCHGIDLRFERAVSTGNYRGLLQELVIRMKNQHDEQIAVQLGKLLALEMANTDFLDDLNLVVPVPSHWLRRFRRGFQAAEIVSETIAADCDIPYAGQIMRCLRGTKKQGTLSTPGRFKNVRGAFDVRANVTVNGLNVLLVDDVMTSGATVSELARMLILRGAAKVYVGVIARGARVS